MRTINQITLKTAVVFPFVLIFLFAIGIIVIVQKNNYETMVSDVSTKQLSTMTSNVNLELRNFLNRPFQASLQLSHTLGFNQFYRKDNTQDIEKYLISGFRNLYREIPQIDAIGFGGINGEYVGFRKELNDRYTLMLQDDRTRNQLVIYRGDEVNDDIRSLVPEYDPRTRPWYVPVAQTERPMWSSIYANVDERQDITLSALNPVFQDQRFVGVMVTDVKIDTFSAFLREKQKETNALIYLFDPKHRLIAQSSTGSIVSWGTQYSDKGERLLLTENSNPVIRRSAQQIMHTDLPKPGDVDQFTFLLDEERYFNRVTPYIDQYGLKWYIGVVIPEGDLLGELARSQRDSWVIGLCVSLLGILVGLIAFNKVTAPITSTATAARNLAKGDWESQMPKPGHIYETTMLVHAFTEMANNLKATFKALRSQLLYDSLTKLYSREGLIDTCDNLRKLNGCLFLIGINKFRDINDSLGHYKGDQLLVIISERLKALFEKDAYIARIGGDEFAIYVDNPAIKIEASLMANRIQKMFASPFSMQQENVVVNVSVGIVAEGSPSNMTLWLRNGSIALSNAKQEPTKISYYKPEMADLSRRKTQMQAKIKDALENEEFVPYYQPIVDLKTGRVVGAEALARWHSNQGVIPPLEFISIAEESGLIAPIGKQILTKACSDTVKGMQQGKWESDFNLHVNLSVDQLSMPDFIDTLKHVLTRTGLQPENLTLEITESRIVDNDPIIVKNMQSIRELNVHIAIDDFGTGYSSLAYLHKLPFNCLKIDRTFVNKLNDKELDNSVVAAIINMTKGMNVNLVAEGIETEKQAEMLVELNCPLGQGFLYSRPMPYEEWPTQFVNTD